ncbi:MAG: helix-turn-helix transcriptional regulator [bacterium]|nr:helix-turn-helix transcriptional regulator [bacterium]
MAVKKESDIYNIIGKNIKKYRNLKGLKQRELAEELYLSDSFIAKLESVTHQTISIDTLEKIANVLDCDIRDFFDKSIIENRENEK